ncbi:hypothetical protein A1O3_09854 [Capronia epimyces CBS 606.96]|uniref:Uncharacterized protein n=1 Tax=Capronia epimyces CBS 606.96 TaxID=1182542 RepID=W9XKX1_9EURO|nr:uncharacterized protein A1O3_09854 [Capronia epimyces CBS 606.96]EXJ77626.1 hypothetical protein A1O3_09854 [Capronia epimyces CBS 606.96]
MEREYKDAEAALKLITEVANEPRIEHPSRPPSISSTAIPERRNPILGTLRPPQRPIYERCTSSPIVPMIATCKTPAGPPDITARELSTEELKRNYSCDNVWHFKDQPLPPMPQMTGFGRYRRAVNAPAQWQLDQLHHNMHDVGAVIVNHLGDCPPAGLDPEMWREYRAHHSRTSSIGSSHSSSSGPGQVAAMEYFDTVTGTRVSRGFCPSNASSAASSLREGSGHYRRDSAMSKASMASPGNDADAKHNRRPSRVSPYQHTSMTSMSPLTAISETQEACNNASRKIEKACEFQDGEIPENAVASDEDDELDWSDMLVVGGAGNVSNLTKRLERNSSSKAVPSAKLTLTRQRTNSQERLKSHAPKRAGPERSKTIKAVTRPTQRRVQLQRKQSATGEAVHTVVALQTERETKRQLAKAKGSSILRPRGDQGGLPDGKQWSEEKTDSAVPQQTMEEIKHDHHISVTPSPTQVAEYGVLLQQSDTSDDTLFAGDTSETKELPLRGKRERSRTVCRIPPSGSPSPVAQMNGDETMKK